MVLAARQELQIGYIITFSNLMAVPDEVLQVVATAVTHNPDGIEKVLATHNDDNLAGPSEKVKTVYDAFSPGSGALTKGLIGSPDLRSLEGHLTPCQTVVTPDVTYIGRESKKPQLVFSDHLKGSIALSLLMVDAHDHPNTAKLLSQLKKFDVWKRDVLRKAYVVLGDQHREYFEHLDWARANIFPRLELAKRMGLSESTIYRVLANRWVEARGIDDEKDLLYANDLLLTQHDVHRNLVVPYLNALMEGELVDGKAMSDQMIIDRIPMKLARRTLAKYRNMAGIPSGRERKKLYQANAITEPYQFPNSRQSPIS